MPPRAAYIHVPFCARRCGYCDFTLVAGRDELIRQYLDALARELSTLGEPRTVETLFVGGGTPSHLPAPELARLVRLLREWFLLAPGGEFSVEANPADIDAEKTAILSEAGVNRVSLGAQSFDDKLLDVLERDHRAGDVVRAVECLRRRVDNISLDLIFAVPGQSLDDWRRTLEAALALDPRHVSTYGLTFEKGTTFWSRRQHGRLVELPDELWREMYALAMDLLTDAGLEQYEISSFARPGYRCRHNLTYWRQEPHYGFGPGAARYIDGRREVNHRSVTGWLKRVQAGKSPIAESEQLSPADRAREFVVLALRTTDGLAREDFTSCTGMQLDGLLGAALNRHREAGLVEDDARRIRLTREGRFVADAVLGEYVEV